MLAMFGAGAGIALLVLFGVYVLWQCTSVEAAVHGDSILQFPCPVAGTELTALQLASYEGPFLEDASQREVVNTAALVVENTGGFVAKGAVVLEIGESRLIFELFDLPPGVRVLVLEKDAEPFAVGQISACYGWEMEGYPEDMGHVTAENAGGMLLSVINQTDDTVPVARICYRTRDPGSGMYLGGISHSIVVRDLQPREQRTVSPPYYAGGSSEILYITTWVEE